MSVTKAHPEQPRGDVVPTLTPEEAEYIRAEIARDLARIERGLEPEGRAYTAEELRRLAGR